MKTLLSRLRARPILSLTAAISLALALVLGVTAWVLNSGLLSNEVVNTEGGYRVEVPDGWSSTKEGRTTTVTSPEGDAIVTFGVGRAGPLPETATLFFQEVGSKYRDVQVFPPEAQHIGSLPALAYGGAGINSNDVAIRFLAITVQSEPTNYNIAVFTHGASDPEAMLPQINELVDSFRELPQS